MKCFVVILFIWSFSCSAQDTLIVEPVEHLSKEYFDNEIIDFPDEEPYFEGGYPAISAWGMHAIPFPLDGFRNKIESKFKITFVVEKNGHLTDIKVNGSPNHKHVSSYLISRMPPWVPAKVNGEPVRSRSSFTLNFSLEG